MIELNGEVFRRHRDGWRKEAKAGWSVGMTFGAASTYEWSLLAAALDEIERLAPENVECRTCKGTNCNAAPFRDLPYGAICRNPEHKCPDCVDGRITTPENVDGLT